ncbi:MAG: thioredoxin [Hyphomicrobiaceae bacterium]|nr:thioredoxin [Hyphomicrobiaceae bacterium]
MLFGSKKPAGGSGGAAAASAYVKDGTTASFKDDVIEASKSGLVLVDFWASWCGPCKQLTPVLEKLVAGYAGKVRLVKINTDENQALAAQLRVQSLPTVYAFRDGRPVDGFMGAQPESVLREFLDRLIGADLEADLAAILGAAEEALAAGDLQGAAETFAAILREDQKNPAALAGLAQCYLKSGDTVRAEQTIGLVPPEARGLAAVQAVTAALALARKAGDAGPRTELEARVAADPADHQARYDLAVALAAAGDKAGAVDHLLEIVRRKRTWNEEAARKQLVELFDAWGPKDPATLDGRRRLSALLFS